MRVLVADDHPIVRQGVGPLLLSQADVDVYNAANSTSYVDDPPFGGPYTYEVLAYNDGGNSAKASTIAKSCDP